MFNSAFSQYKDDISIVQFTADFVESVSLDKYKKHNTFTFLLNKDTKIFTKRILR